MKLIISSILVLIATLGYCQETYPKLVVINKDTVVGVTQQQSRDINKIFIEWSYYKEVTDTLERKVLLLGEKIRVDSLIIDEKDLQIQLHQSTLENEKLYSDNLQKEADRLSLELRRQKIKTRASNILLTISLLLNVILATT